MTTAVEERQLPVVTKDIAIAILQTMARIRAFEDRIHELKAVDKLEGFIHLVVGQEAVDGGVCAALRDGDSVFTTFRNHGQCIARGMDMNAMMAEMFGRATGVCGGRGGSMHLADHTRRVFGGNGIVGSSPPLALGPALTAKTLGTTDVSVAFFGEGAAQQGTTHEALNLAAIWQLPVIFVCSNNMYAQSTPITYASLVPNIADRAAAYGMPGVTVDGQNAEEVFEAAMAATERARAGNGPTLIEAKTFLFYGAWEGEHPDSKVYRSKQLEAEYLQRDPLTIHETTLIRRRWLSRDKADAIRRDAEQKVDAAVRYAEESAWPEYSGSAADVYASWV